MSPEVFVNLLKNKPNKAIFWLYGQSNAIKNWIKYNSGSAEQADDILQEAVTVLYQNLTLKNMPLTTKPSYYLSGIAKNLWLAQLRKDKKIIQVPLAGLADIEVEQMELPDLDLPQLLTQLGSKCDVLLRLFYFERKSMEFIAKKLDFRNAKVAKAMKYKCLQKAKKILFNQP